MDGDMLTSISRVFALALALAAFAPAKTHAKDTGLIFVSNEKTNNLIIIDPKTYQVVKDLKISRRPRDMHFNADHTRLYVACGDDDVIDIIYVSNEEGSSLSIIDIDQNIIVQEVPTGAEPEGVFISDDGKTLYVTSEVGD